MIFFTIFAFLFACSSSDKDTSSDDEIGFTYLDPSDIPDFRGSGGPHVSFEEEDLWNNCAALMGGEQDYDHHNLVVPYRGHLVMPWSPEFGTGGISFFDMEDPCQPQKIAEGWHDRMRESHALGFVHLREDDPDNEEIVGDYLVLTGSRGIQFWNVSDLDNLEMIHYLEIEGVFYPDSYTRVVLSVFWQYPYVYVAAADNGIFVVDAKNPYEPEVITHYPFNPILRAAGVFAQGNDLLVTSAEGEDAVILDISDPINPQPIAGGSFVTYDSEGEAIEAYHANRAGNLALFARKEGGGGVMVYDISNPNTPTFVGDVKTEGGNGGYVFYDEGFLFLGDSHWGKVFDGQDLTNITEIGTGYLAGDLDTMTPFGNVAILSVDDEAEDEISSAVMPWRTDPDITGPKILDHSPKNGATGLALTTRIGIGCNEAIEPSSVFAGSIRIFDEKGNGIDGWGNAQENTINFTPKNPLEANTTYRVEIKANGIRDAHGNVFEEDYIFSFTTGM